MVAEYTKNIAVTSEGVKYLTTDMLGSPRAITNSAGQVASRHDYMPFGEEVAQGIGGRTEAQGYLITSDGIRQQFTGYERDSESGLDYAQNRYYASKHGRFTAVDPLTASANMRNPQTFNRYSYVMNSPYKFVDPLGLAACTSGERGGCDPDGTDEQERSNAEQNNQNDPVATETASVVAGKKKITVTVSQVNSPDVVATYPNPDKNNKEPVLRVGVELVFNYKIDGVNVEGTASESVEVLEGEDVVQDNADMTLKDGNNNDLVSSPAYAIPKSRQEHSNLTENLNKDFVTKQKITITVKAKNRMVFKVTQIRTLTNKTKGVKPLRRTAGRVRGYTFKMSKPTIEVVSNGTPKKTKNR